MDTILSIPLSYNLPKDKLIWVGNRRGDFTIKNAYYITLNVVDSFEEWESSSEDIRTLSRVCINVLPTMIN